MTYYLSDHSLPQLHINQELVYIILFQIDVVIAKNYLTEEELKVLNNLVSGYFDFAEIQAIRHKPMYMEDYIRQLDTILSSAGEKILVGSGTVSHNQAINKAKS